MNDIAALALGAYLVWSGVMAVLHPPQAIVLGGAIYVDPTGYRLGALLCTCVLLTLLMVAVTK